MASALLKDEMKLQHLRKGALASARKYSMDVMVNNFKSGILKCLAQ
jgi:hypothetical protein